MQRNTCNTHAKLIIPPTWHAGARVTRHTRFFCGVGNLPFVIAGACVALFLFAAVAHTCPWKGPNQPKLAPLSNLTTYTPGLEVRALRGAGAAHCRTVVTRAHVVLTRRGVGAGVACVTDRGLGGGRVLCILGSRRPPHTST